MQEIDLPPTAPASAPVYRQLESPVERVIVPAKRRVKLRDLLREGAVIRVLAARDFKVKYKQSLLGPLWLVFQPLALLGAFVVAFRNLANVSTSGVPYIVFALAGLTVWSFFQAGMTIGTSSIISNQNFVRFTPCPRPAFPLAAVLASLPSFAITALGAIIAAAASGRLSVRVLLLPVGLLWLLVFTVGVVAITASLAVRFRDIIAALPFLLQVGVFLAPVGYTLAGLGGTMRKLVEINPLTGVMETMRWLIISGYHPGTGPIAISLAETAVLVTVGWLLFSRIETTMADEI